MIGNLVLSLLAVSFVGGVVGSGYIKADSKALANSTSWVNGQDCVVYASGSIHQTSTYNVNNAHLGQYLLYDFDGEELDDDSVNNTNYQRFLDDLNNQIANTQADSYMFFFGQIQTFAYDSNAYWFCMRVGVPYQSNISGFEFRSNTDIVLFRYDESFNGSYIPCSYFRQGNSYQNAIGIYSPSNYGFNDHVISSGVSRSNDNYFPYLMSEYLIVFQGNLHGGSQISLDIEFQFINGGSNDYMLGYNNGYGSGYSQGVSTGYENGYADGLATASAGGFHGLFNAIADTPLRFLYGLFNFDLFGLSMLVIVLTLLTGIIVFGIVKKFWK